MSNFESIGSAPEPPAKTELERSWELRAQQEKDTLSVFKGKAGRVARALMLATALATGVSGAGASIYFLDSYVATDMQRESQTKKERTHRGEGSIIDMRHIPAGSRPISFGLMTTSIPTPEEWRVTILVDGHQGEIDVTQEQFASMANGQRVPVTYESLFHATDRIDIVSIDNGYN